MIDTKEFTKRARRASRCYTEGLRGEPIEYTFGAEGLLAFARQIEAETREADAKICDAMPYGSLRGECANAIRATTNKE